METTDNIILKIRGLSASYEGKAVLRDVNLDVAAHDFLGITGPNGGGKTTLMRCILGLKKPDGGTVSYVRPLRIGYLPQINMVDRRFPITVGEVVLSGLQDRGHLTGRHSAADRTRADEVMQRVGIGGIASKPIGELSGGQVQRAMLARAIIDRPELLILDEPNTYLDREFQGHLQTLLRDINRHCAIILVSHDRDAITAQARAIAYVDHGIEYRINEP